MGIQRLEKLTAGQTKFMLKSALWVLIANPQASGNVIGSDFQLFNANFSGIDFLSVEPSRTLAPGQFAASGFFDVGTNLLPNVEIRDLVPSRTNIDDSIFSLQTLIGYGVVDHLELGVSLPMILAENSSSSNFRGEITSAGFSFFRMAAKYQLFSSGGYGIAAAFDMGTSLMNNNPYTGSGSQTAYTSMLILDAEFENFSLGSNIGYKTRSSGANVVDSESNRYPIEPISSQLLWSAAGSFKIQGQDKLIIGEIVGATALGKVVDDSDRSNSTAEVLISYKHRLNESVQLTAGIGTEVLHGPGSAGLRAVMGASMSFNTTPIGDLYRTKMGTSEGTNFRSDMEGGSGSSPSSLPSSEPSFLPELPENSEFSDHGGNTSEITPDQYQELSVDDKSYELDITPKVPKGTQGKKKLTSKNHKKPNKNRLR